MSVYTGLYMMMLAHIACWSLTCDAVQGPSLSRRIWCTPYTPCFQAIVQHSSLPLLEAIRRFEEQRNEHRREAMRAGWSGSGAQESLAFARVERAIVLWQRLAQGLLQHACNDIKLVGSFCKKLQHTLLSGSAPASDKLLRVRDAVRSTDTMAAACLSSEHGREGFVMNQTSQGFRLRDDGHDQVPADPCRCVVPAMSAVVAQGLALTSSKLPVITPNALPGLHAGGSRPRLLLARQQRHCKQRRRRGDAQGGGSDSLAI